MNTFAETCDGVPVRGNPRGWRRKLECFSPLGARPRSWAVLGQVGKILAAAAGAVGLLVVPASAQFNSAPVFHDPTPGSIDLWTVAPSFSGGLNGASGKNVAPTLHLSRSISWLALTGGIGLLNPTSEAGSRRARLQVMGQVAVRVIPRPETEEESADYSPISIDVLTGIGYADFGDQASQLNLPIGVGVAYAIEYAGWAILPWVAPRLSIVRIDLGDVDETQTGLGFSAGANLGFTAGFGVFAAVDALWFGEKSVDGVTLPKRNPWVLGGGLRYRW